MCDVPEFVRQREREQAIAARKKVARLNRIAQIKAVDDQLTNSCNLCRSDAILEGWKFSGYWLVNAPIDKRPEPWLIVCPDCYKARFREDCTMMRAMKNAPSSRLIYHITVNSDATFAVLRVEPWVNPSRRTQTP
eukprot:jgi/Mesvir1/5630/Mv15648-RA.1